MDHLTPHVTAFHELPPAPPTASGFAGEGTRADPERANPLWWRIQVYNWGLSGQRGMRLWRVVMRGGNSGRTKIERVLPSGRMIRVFEDDGLASSHLTLKERRQDGPLYELPYADAAALWRDRFIQCHPACEQFIVRPTDEVSHVA